MRRAKQIELGFWRGSHLGEASRPGRRPGPNPRVPHEPREGVAKRLPCHVVLEVRRGIPSLRNWRVVREIEASFRKACSRNGFRLVHYSIQDDHAHLIVETDDRERLACGMKSIAARFARAVNRALARSGPVLADRYHHTVLETPRQVRNALAYVLLNARRHAAKRLAKLRKRGKRRARASRAPTCSTRRRPRAGSRAGGATSSWIARRRTRSDVRPRWERRRRGSSTWAGDVTASWTRTRSRAACAPDAPIRPGSLRPPALRPRTDRAPRWKPGAPAPPIRSLLPFQSLPAPVRFRSGSEGGS